LDERIRRRASGGQDEYTLNTHIPCGAFTLEALIVGTNPIENYRSTQSIPLRSSSFYRMRGCLYDVSIPTFPGPEITAQARVEYGNEQMPTSGLKSRAKEVV
jgi:hypothetical protein